MFPYISELKCVLLQTVLVLKTISFRFFSDMSRFKWGMYWNKTESIFFYLTQGYLHSQQKSEKKKNPLPLFHTSKAKYLGH